MFSILIWDAEKPCLLPWNGLKPPTAAFADVLVAFVGVLVDDSRDLHMDLSEDLAALKTNGRVSFSRDIICTCSSGVKWV